MLHKYRDSRRAWIMIVLALVVVTVGVLTLGGNRLAVASRLVDESDTSAGTIDQAAVPATFGYQGILRDVDGSLITGPRDITIRIYDNAIGGAVLHDETVAGVQVRDGVFNVVLGDVTPVAPEVYAESPRFLGFTVAPDPEMVPRQRLHPVPWAQQATTAAQAGFAIMANQAMTANQAASATQASRASTLNDNATVNGLTVNTSLTIPTYGSLRIEAAPETQTHPYFSMGGQGSFDIDSPDQAGGRFKVDTYGNVGIGVHQPAFKLDVWGKVRATEGFNGKCIQQGQVWHGTCNQDVAETFAATEWTEPGDVVVLQPLASEEPTVQLSQRPYTDQLMGVVSSNPGLVFDQGNTFLAGDNANLISEDRTVVAMIGRVPVKISLENGDIAVGDPLASASVPGAAMKATKAGQIIGYALASSDESREGKILAWLQLGYYVPQDLLAELNGGATAAPEVVASTPASDLESELAQLRAESEALISRIEALEGNR